MTSSEKEELKYIIKLLRDHNLCIRDTFIDNIVRRLEWLIKGRVAKFKKRTSKEEIAGIHLNQ